MLMRRLARHAGLRVFRVFARRLEAGETPMPASALNYRLMAERDLLAFCDEAAFDLRAWKVRAAYGRGDICVGAFDGTILAGYCWFAFSAAPHLDGVWLDFPRNVVYTYKSYVRPALRGQRIAAALYRFADDLFLERGRNLTIICVESHNAPSIAAAKRSGFSTAGYAGYVTRGGRMLAWRSPAAARFGLRFYVPPSEPD
jgi:GNAT superfamily N-acetyltransferase